MRLPLALALALVLSTLGAPATAVAGPEPSRPPDSERIARFFRNWFRWAPDTTVRAGDPIGTAGDFFVYRVERTSSDARFNDIQGTVYDSNRDELLIGEVMFAPPRDGAASPFDEATDLPMIAADLERTLRTKVTLEREAAKDRPPLLLAYRAVLKTPIGPYGLTTWISMDKSLLLIGNFVPLSSSAKLVRGEILSRRKGPRMDSKKLVIHEFADFECPLCRKGTEELTAFLAANPSLDATIEFHNFPLYVDHKWSPVAASCGACLAGISSEAFFRYEGLVFGKQASFSADGARQLADDIAVEIGEKVRYSKCVAEKTGEARVLAEIEAGFVVGVRATPTYFVEGTMVSGEPGRIEEYLRVTYLKPAAGTKGGAAKKTKKGPGK